MQQPTKSRRRSGVRPFHRNRRDDMQVSLTEGGTLQAADEVSIVSKLESEADIIYLIPEGTLAEKGDLLVETAKPAEETLASAINPSNK